MRVKRTYASVIEFSLPGVFFCFGAKIRIVDIVSSEFSKNAALDLYLTPASNVYNRIKFNE